MPNVGAFKLPEGGAPYLALAAAIIVIYFVAKREIVTGVKAVGGAINPTSPDNVFYGGVNQVGGIITDTSDFSLGGWIYDITHADPMAPQGANKRRG